VRERFWRGDLCSWALKRFKAGPREGAYGYQRRRGGKSDGKEKGHLGGRNPSGPSSPRPVRPCRHKHKHKLLLSKGLWPLGLGGQVKCPAKGFAPATSVASGTEGLIQILERDTANLHLGSYDDCIPLLGSGSVRHAWSTSMVACCGWVGVEVAASTWCCTEADWRPPEPDLTAGENPFPPHTQTIFFFLTGR